MNMNCFSRKLVVILVIIFLQSSLGTNAALKDFSNVTTKSLLKNGYYKFPDGLLIQWGETNGGANKSIYLATSYYNGDYVVLTTSVDGNQTLVINHNVIARYNSYFKITSTYLNNGSGTGIATTGVLYITIGRWK